MSWHLTAYVLLELGVAIVLFAVALAALAVLAFAWLLLTDRVDDPMTNGGPDDGE